MHFLKRKGDLLDRSVYDILHVKKNIFMTQIFKMFLYSLVLRNVFHSDNCIIVILLNVIS